MRGQHRQPSDLGRSATWLAAGGGRVGRSLGPVLSLGLLLVCFPATAALRLVRDCPAVAGSAWSTSLWEAEQPGLFRQEAFPVGGSWQAEDPRAPGLFECFGEATPPSSRVLLHRLAPVGPPQPHPVLLVPGAGDHALRLWSILGRTLADRGHAVTALTFAQPQGDNYQHGELIAQVVAQLTEAAGTTVDLVAHSMGGLAAAIHAAHHPGVSWSQDDRGRAFTEHGTPYAGGLRRLILLGVPLGGVDTAFRWPNTNFSRIQGLAISTPIAWDTYYWYSTANLFFTLDLEPYGYFAEPEVYPGQLQALARWEERFPLPGSLVALGEMAVQVDWYTTYWGGLGFWSYSQGIEAALARGQGVLEPLAMAGVDPRVELYLAAGRNPILPVEATLLTLGQDMTLATYGATLAADWLRLELAWLDPVFPWHAAWGEDPRKLFRGEAVFGELSGPSDGVVFHASATATEILTARGAVVHEVRTFDGLNHLELAQAGALAAELLEATDPLAAAKYGQPEQQATEWVAEVLARPDPAEGEGSGGDAGGDASVEPADASDDRPDASLDHPDAGSRAEGGVEELDPADLGAADQGPATPDSAERDDPGCSCDALGSGSGRGGRSTWAGWLLRLIGRFP